MRSLTKLLLLTLISSFFVACNTVHGAGEDISSGGQAISSAATSVQKKM
ncbi:MAG TPA: entericidin A/B family lipoprotein [Coxiellaceae bacterium]|nr:entericidin A/B family lipoprotein [Coxiellaceae bacterium]